MTGPDLTLLVLLACGAQGTRVEAEAARPCLVDDARDAPDGGPGEVAGGAMQAQEASQEGEPAEARPKEVFYSVTLGAGFSHNYTDGEFARFAIWKPGRHGVTFDVGEQHDGSDSSVGFGASYWRDLDPVTTLSVSAGGGTAPFAPRFGIGASISRPFLTVGFSVGASYTEWRDGAYTAEVSVGATRWFPHWIVGGGAAYSQGEPADFMGWRGSVGLSYFVWRKTSVGVGVDFGELRQREFRFDTRSRGVNVGFSQWFTDKSGINLSAGRSLDNDTYGFAGSWFKEW